MPSYEAVLLLKKLARPELVNVLKRTATQIYDSSGVLFAIENLGTRALPYAISKHGRRHREGSYFLMRFDASTQAVKVLRDEYYRDIDIIRAGFVRLRPPSATEVTAECTLDEDLKPPAYREDVKKMIEDGRRRDKYKFQPKHQLTRDGEEYYPFHR